MELPDRHGLVPYEDERHGADEIVCIGHLGDCNDLTLLAALAGVEMGLKLGGVPVTSSGVAAAMERFSAER